MYISFILLDEMKVCVYNFPVVDAKGDLKNCINFKHMNLWNIGIIGPCELQLFSSHHTIHSIPIHYIQKNQLVGSFFFIFRFRHHHPPRLIMSWWPHRLANLRSNALLQKFSLAKIREKKKNIQLQFLRNFIAYDFNGFKANDHSDVVVSFFFGCCIFRLVSKK